MKRLSIIASALAATWLTLVAVASAQAPSSLESPPSRVPRPPLSTPVVPSLDESRVSASVLEPRTVTSNPRAERNPRKLAPVPINDDRFTRIHWDTAADGTVWVKARGYKASFGSDGATYFPLFGGEQPRHFPIAMSLASATSDGLPIALEPVQGAVRKGDTVVIERGVIDEVYEVVLEGVEQTFVVESKPEGDLKLFVKVETELDRQECDTGFKFSNTFGSVGYGTAFARESNGKKRPLPTRLVEGGIEIEIDADFMATAEFPLVVDPLISTFNVDTTTFVNSAPCVAYDVTTDHYIYVYAERPVVLDSDGYSEILDASGAVVSGAYVDLTTEDWLTFSVANLNAYDRFLVVADTGTITSAGGSTVGSVKARLTNAGSLSYDPVFTIAAGGFGSSVGGDSYAIAPSYFCVAYTTPGGFSAGISARLVTNTGSLLGATPLVLDPGGAPGTAFLGCDVSPSNGGVRWNIAWQEGFTTTDADIWGAQVEWNGALTTPKFLVAGTTADDSNPQASSPFDNGEYVIAWWRIFASDDDVMAARISGGTVLSTHDLSVLEGGTHYLLDQHVSDIDCDGQQLAIIYNDQTASGPTPLFISSFHVMSGALQPSEVRVSLPSGDFGAQLVSTASTGGAVARFAVGWSSADDIYGAFYRGLIGGPVTTACAGDGSGTACPCANNGSTGSGCGNSVNASGAQLIGSGDADLSSDTLALTAIEVTPGAPCLFFQGTSLYSGGSGIVFGDGLICAGGTITRMAVKFASGTSAIFPSGGDPALSVAGAVPAGGGARFYQVWYRDSAVFCSASTFNLTNAVKVVWLP